MADSKNPGRAETVIATIENQNDPRQVIAIKYLREENAFVTDGILENLGEKEILMPAHLIAKDLSLIGTIVSAVLEKISQAHEKDMPFEYVSQFEVMDGVYSFTEHGEYMMLEAL